jgi:TonB family protein
MINWIADPAVSLILFYLAYAMFLRRLAFFRANRLYLLTAMLFSFAVPFIKFSPPVPFMNYTYFIPEVTTGQEVSVAATPGTGLSIAGILLYIYIAGVFFLLFRLLLRIMQLLVLASWNRTGKFREARIVSFKAGRSPFSFFNFIFINESLYTEEEKNKILEHELAHIRQFHTLDLLLAELLTIFQWFNPVSWLYRKSIAEVHEFLADEEVIKNGTSIPFYQSMLAGLQLGREFFPLGNNFNRSLTLDRIRMMAATRPPGWKRIRFFLLLPVTIILILMCTKAESEMTANGITNTAGVSLTEVADFADFEPAGAVKSADGSLRPARSDEYPEIFFIVEEMPDFQGGGQEAFRRHIAENLRYPASAAENGIQGRVFVQFVVKADGSVDDARIARGVEPSLDREALRVVMSSPPWTPGRQRGQPVNVAFTFPINFVLL